MTQHAGLDERLERIRSQQKARAAERARPARGVSRLGEMFGNALYPLSIIGAFLLGMLAVAIGHFVRFHASGGVAPDPEDITGLITTLVMGMATSFILGQMFRLRDKEHLSVQSLGIVVAVSMFHNIFHWLPAPAAFVFSPDYVAQMQERTPANSIVFGGMALELGGAETDG